MIFTIDLENIRVTTAKHNVINFPRECNYISFPDGAFIRFRTALAL